MKVVDDRHHVENRQRAQRRSVTCPEGVPLAIQVADVGARFAALTLDLLIMGGLILVSALMMSTVIPLVLSAVTIFMFLVVNFYFTFFELRMRGQTPGKRTQNIRVIDSRGGPLTSEAVIARNLVRNIELWLPLNAWFQPGAFYQWVPDGFAWLPVLWILLFLFFPLFNRDRRRIGDLIAGTMVVEVRRQVLGSDLSVRGAKKSAAGYRFTREQLDIYGRHELQVLEEILRERSRDRKVLGAACAKIREKIGWEATGRVKPRAFLEAFYAAQRAHLEQKLLMGEKRESKEDAPGA